MKWMALLCAATAMAAQREVAITIDDLPRGGDGGGTSYEAVRAMTVRLLAPFQEQKIPLIGFVNAGRNELSRDELRKILDLWMDAGADLANHTWSHPSLNTVTVEQFKEEIVKNEEVLRPMVEARGKKLEFFRYPGLMMGPTAETKHAIADFVKSRGYRNAPVTFDNSDYMYALAFTNPALTDRVRREYVPYLESVIAFFETRSVEVVGREFPQIMLLHASELNSRMMPDILAMFRRRGCRFISLDQALKDDAYRQHEDYIGRGGFSWIHRWSQAKGMENKGEPDEPEWVRQEFQKRR